MKLILRSLADSLAFYPALLLLMEKTNVGLPLPAWLGLAWLAAAIGRLLPAILRVRVPAVLVHLALIALACAIAGNSDPHLLLVVLPLGVLSWIARLDWPRTVRCSVAVGLHAFILAAAPLLDVAPSARPLLLAAGIVWLAAALYFLQARSLADAGLQAGIVTRGLARSGRRYLALWGLLVALVFLPFAGVPIWPAVVRFMRWLIALAPADSPVPEPTPETQATEQPPMFPPQDRSTSPIWVWLEYALYVALALLVLAVLYAVIHRYLLRADWWRQLSGRVKAWYDSLLRKRGGEEDLGYTDERERLLRGEKLLGRWFSRRGAKPKRGLRRDEWSALPAAERVRSLYASVVADAVKEGYAHLESRTPSETIRAIEAWRAGKEGLPSSKEGPAAIRWLVGKTAQLGELYGRARYGGNVKPEEADRLGAEYPWRQR